MPTKLVFANLTLAFERDNTVGVEEGFLQPTALPYGFTVKAGRFFSGIGYLNEQHSHVWDFVDQPLPYMAFLNTQYDDEGVQVRWLAPTADVPGIRRRGSARRRFPGRRQRKPQ